MPKSFIYGKLGLSYRRDRKESATAIKGFTDSNRFLSNFYPCTFKMYDLSFCCSEQAYMYHKSDNARYRTKLMSLTSPKDMKHLGRTVVLRKDWEEIKFKTTYNVLCLKFAEPHLKAKLLATDFAYLEETNWWNDTIWGVCRNKGSNNLGRILMCVRHKFFIGIDNAWHLRN